MIKQSYIGLILRLLNLFCYLECKSCESNNCSNNNDDNDYNNDNDYGNDNNDNYSNNNSKSNLIVIYSSKDPSESPLTWNPPFGHGVKLQTVIRLYCVACVRSGMVKGTDSHKMLLDTGNYYNHLL